MSKLSTSFLCFLFVALISPVGAAALGSVSGTLKSGATPINGFINLYRADNLGSAIRQTTPDGTGFYSFANLTDGSYVVRTLFGQSPPSISYVDEVFPNLQCVGIYCPLSSGTVLVVAGGNAVTGINFDLEVARVLNGVVTDGFNGIEGVYISLFDAAGHLLGDRLTPSSGAFGIGGLPNGSYFIKTYNNLGYIDEVYDNIACVGGNCPASTGTAITIVNGPISLVTIVLSKGDSISGTVRDTQSGLPIEKAELEVYSESGSIVRIEETDAQGNYKVRTGLAAGNYYLRAVKEGYFSELFSELTCDDPCDLTLGSLTEILGVGIVEMAGHNFTLLKRPEFGAPSAELAVKLSKVKLLDNKVNGRVTVKNSGQAASGKFDLRLFQLSEKLLRAASRSFKRFRVKSLAPGESKSFTYSKPRKPAAKFVIGVADSGDVVSEILKTDNNAARKIPRP